MSETGAREEDVLPASDYKHEEPLYFMSPVKADDKRLTALISSSS